MIEREAQRLERLIRDLLDLARLRRRSFDVTMRATDLGEIAHEALARHTPQAQDYGVNLVVRVDGPSGADRRRAAARCRRSPTSSRTRSVAPPTAGRSRSSPTPGRLAVVDDGPGIEPDDLDRAFERFYLWERYGVDRPVGSGLGLAIVAELATAMRGRVTVTSTPGHGSEFALELEPAPVPDHSAYARLTQR